MKNVRQINSQARTVWDVETGKIVKSWDKYARVVFNPVRPLLAVLEPNRDWTQVGLWDFSSEASDKK